MEDWNEDGFYPAPSDDVERATFAQRIHAKLCDCVDGNRQTIAMMCDTWVVVFDEITQKIVLDKHDCKIHKKEKKWNTYQDNKKLVMDTVPDNSMMIIRNQNWNFWMDMLHAILCHTDSDDVVGYLKKLRNDASGSSNDGDTHVFYPFQDCGGNSSLY